MMEQIRYTARICTDSDRIENFLREERVGVLSIKGGEYPYGVPVNYLWHEGAVYFHGMGSGKKTELLPDNPEVCFTVYREYKTVPDPVPCHADTSYMSIMIFGKAEKITDSGEAAAVLQKLVDKFLPGFYKQKMSASYIEKYRSSMDNKGVLVYRISPSCLTAKENRA